MKPKTWFLKCTLIMIINNSQNSHLKTHFSKIKSQNSFLKSNQNSILKTQFSKLKSENSFLKTQTSNPLSNWRNLKKFFRKKKGKKQPHSEKDS